VDTNGSGPRTRLDPLRLNRRSQAAFASLLRLESGWYVLRDLAEAMAEASSTTLQWTDNLLRWAARDGVLPSRSQRPTSGRRRVQVYVDGYAIERQFPSWVPTTSHYLRARCVDCDDQAA
jgi:hypothetical protein